MKHYLHALLAPPAKVGFAQLRAAVADLPLLGGPIQITPSGDYLLVHSDYEQDEIRQTRRNMIAHTRVLETLLPLVTVLPMRFGLLTSDLDAVQKLILVRTEEIVAQAARVANHAEYGLRVSFPRAAPRRITRASISGAASRNCSIDGAAQKALVAALAGEAATGYVLRKPESDVEILRAEFLLPVDGADAFAERAVDIARGLSFAPETEPQVQLIGPVPAYHFVSLTLDPRFEEAEA